MLAPGGFLFRRLLNFDADPGTNLRYDFSVEHLPVCE